MVKLYSSLLALTLATSSALASYQDRRGRIGIVIRQRDLDQDFSGREYLLDARGTYDDLEARSFLSALDGEAGSEVGKLVVKHGLKKGGNPSHVAKKAGEEVANHWKAGVSAKNNIPAVLKNIFEVLKKHGGFHPNRRGLEDDEELLQRDFDDEFEVFFGREYDDFLIERDIFQNVLGATLNDISAVFKKHDGSRPNRRGLEDDEELLRRDFDDEFFGREYDDFLQLRDAFDDLD